MKRDTVYLQDVLAAAQAAMTYLRGLSREDFLAQPEKQDAVIRTLEVMGEGARRLSAEAKQAIPDVPWRRLIDMRNILIHQYDSVDLDIVYDTVTRFLLPLIQRVQRALGDRLVP